MWGVRRLSPFSYSRFVCSAVLSTCDQMGHVDAGKSTLTGHLLHDLGFVPAKEMHRNRKDATQQVTGREGHLRTAV